jgi:hypothetical protein
VFQVAFFTNKDRKYWYNNNKGELKYELCNLQSRWIG